MRNCGVPWRGRIIKSSSVSEADTMIPNYEFRIPIKIKKSLTDILSLSRTNIHIRGTTLIHGILSHALCRILSYSWRLTHISTLQNTPQEIAQMTEQITHAQPSSELRPSDHSPRNSHSRTHVWLHPRRSICWLVFHLTLITAGSLWKHHQLYLRFIGFIVLILSRLNLFVNMERNIFLF